MTATAQAIVVNKLPTNNPDDRHEIIATALAGLEQGKSLRQVAEDLGMVYATLRVWLLDDVPEKYKPAQRRALLTRIAEADENLEGALSNIAIARAREIARFSRWDAERRLPALFAPRQEITGPGGGPIQLANIERARRFDYLSRTIDVEPIAVQHEERTLTDLSTDKPAEETP